MSAEGPPRRAIVATSRKDGVRELGAALAAMGWELYGTSGTVRHLADAGVPSADTATLTGLPELLGGRLKTLHPAVFGGLLYRRGEPGDEADLARHGLPAIDLVACNFYAFEEAVALPDTSLEDALSQIDVGGPAMVRAAAKNHPSVLPLVDPADYPGVVAALRRTSGRPAGVRAGERRRLAVKALRATAAYDAAIAHHLEAL